jgi:nitroreductase
VLPAAQQWGGKPLLEALKERRSTREFSPRALSIGVLSTLLWAAFGIRNHVLRARDRRDLRALTGLQAFAADAPVNLVYVADLSRMVQASPEEQAHYAGPDASFIAENVYLFCASEGLATVVRGMMDRAALAAAMGLAPRQSIILAQSVGYPREP